MNGSLSEMVLDIELTRYGEEFDGLSCHDQRDSDDPFGFGLNTGFTFDPRLQSSFQEQNHFKQHIDPPWPTLDTHAAPNHFTKHGLTTPPSATEADIFNTVAETCLPNGGVQNQNTERATKPTEQGSLKRKRRGTKPVGITACRDRGKRIRPANTRKARTGYKATSKEQEDDPEGKEKRRRFLERNRTAATKCRQKKKAWVDQLEEKFRDGQARHCLLVDVISNLQSELIQLKEEALKHFDCDTDIRSWLIDRLGSTQNTITAAPAIKHKDQRTP